MGIGLNLLYIKGFGRCNCTAIGDVPTLIYCSLCTPGVRSTGSTLFIKPFQKKGPPYCRVGYYIGFVCQYKAGHALLEKKLNVAGTPRYYRNQFMILHKLVHDVRIFVQYLSLIHVVSRFPRYISYHFGQSCPSRIIKESRKAPFHNIFLLQQIIC